MDFGNVDDFKLPEELEYIREAIGLLGAMLVAEAFGGSSLFIPAPKTLNGDHALVEVLGHARALQLCEHYQVHSSIGGEDRHSARGSTILIPMARYAFAKLRARAMLQAGYSINAVVRATGVHRRTVSRWIARFDRDAALLDAAIASDSEFKAVLNGDERSKRHPGHRMQAEQAK